MNWKMKLGCASVALVAVAGAPVVIGQQRAIRTV
jgi:hypothetical protein